MTCIDKQCNQSYVRLVFPGATYCEYGRPESSPDQLIFGAAIAGMTDNNDVVQCNHVRRTTVCFDDMDLPAIRGARKLHLAVYASIARA